MKERKGRLSGGSRFGCMPRGPYGQGDKWIIAFERRQPSTIHPIAFYRLVLYCTVSDQIDLLSYWKVV